MLLSLQPEFKASLAGIQAVVQLESSGPLERAGPTAQMGVHSRFIQTQAFHFSVRFIQHDSTSIRGVILTQTPVTPF